MANFYGADIEQLRSLGREFDREADQLDSITVRLTGRITGVSWTGPAAQRFTSEWHDYLANTMRAVASGLRSASSQANQSARDQEDASGGAGSTSDTATSVAADAGVLASTSASNTAGSASLSLDSVDAFMDLPTFDQSAEPGEKEQRDLPRRGRQVPEAGI